MYYIFKNILNLDLDFNSKLSPIKPFDKSQTHYSGSLLVIDSLSILDDFCRFDENRSLFVSLINGLKKIGFTTIFITEKNLKNQYASEKYLCDGIIILEHRDKIDKRTKQAKRGEYNRSISYTKTIKCEKMRTKKINTGYFSFEFVDGNFKFEPYEYVL